MDPEKGYPRVCMFVIGATKRSRGMKYANPYLRCAKPIDPGLDFCREHHEIVSRSVYACDKLPSWTGSG